MNIIHHFYTTLILAYYLIDWTDSDNFRIGEKIRYQNKMRYQNINFDRGPDKISVQLGIYSTRFLSIAFFQKQLLKNIFSPHTFLKMLITYS